MESKELHREILNNKQKFIFKNISFLKKEGFYLAGGTALALQIGHRHSLDFDFYLPKKFDSNKLLKLFQKNFKKIQVINQEEDTLLLSVEGINLSFFTYKYPLLKPLIKIQEINLASLEDIAAMKLVAIIQRKSKRDYIDLFYLLENFGLEKILILTEKKYKGLFNPYLGLRALIYFEDIETEKDKQRNKLIADFNWNKIKKELIKMVKDFKNKKLKNK